MLKNIKVTRTTYFYREKTYNSEENKHWDSFYSDPGMKKGSAKHKIKSWAMKKTIWDKSDLARTRLPIN